MDSMKARHFAPVAPLHTQPVGPYVGIGHREEALADALRGVELGACDELIMGWMVRFLDLSTLRVVVSVIERARIAGMIEAVDAENGLRARHRAGPVSPPPVR